MRPDPGDSEDHASDEPAADDPLVKLPEMEFRPDNASVGQQRPHVYSSQELLQGFSEAWIEHEGRIYRLRVTSRSNLLLTR